MVGETKTANVPSLFTVAVPTSLIVLFSVLAYSKSTSVTLDMPAVGTFFVSIDFLCEEKKIIIARYNKYVTAHYDINQYYTMKPNTIMNLSNIVA